MRPRGYNEHRIVYADGKYYNGAKNTLVIMIKGKTGGDIELSWIKGDND